MASSMPTSHAPLTAPDDGGGDRRDATTPLAAAAGLYLVSGAAGLVYEVALARRLLLLVGSTATTAALVLAAFLAGLGAGGAWGGRRADRSRRPLALYGVLELGAAAWAVLVLPLLAWIEPAHRALAEGGGAFGAVADALLVVVAVGPVAFLLGATFPAMLRTVTPATGSVRARASVLYGVNTSGAVGGALWAGFVAIYDLGVSGTVHVAALAAAVVGGVACLVARRRDAAPSTEATSVRGVPRAPLAVAFLTGFVALGLEASGVRILVFFVEGFSASFAAMLGVFLAGLAAGSLVLGPAFSGARRPGVVVGGLLLLTGACVALLLRSLPGFEDVLRGVRADAFARLDPLAAQRWCALVGAALLFAAPALLLGACYPLCVRWAADARPERLGAAAGRVAAANALGAAAGPLVVLALNRVGGLGGAPGGPLLAFAAIGVLAIAAGALVAGLASRGPWLRLAGVLAAGLACAGLGPALLAEATPAALVEASRVVRGPDGRRERGRHVVELRSDETTTVTVLDTPQRERVLYTDEFAAAATGPAYDYMRLLGHLPVLAAADPAHAMVIAFGTGTTAGAVAAHPEVKRLEVVETSRAVLAMAPHFSLVNHDVLKTEGGRLVDARVRVAVDDGRRALARHAPDLDVITLEPLMPYTPAALPFYTREFYALARSRLRDGGVIAQWVPVHAMPLELYAALVGTFFDVFPDGSLWFFEQSTVLIGRVGEARPSPDAVRARVEPVRARLGMAGIERPEALASAWVASGRRVRAVLADPARSTEEAVRARPPGPGARRVVVDDVPFPEAHPLPRATLHTSYLSDTLLWLTGLVVEPDDPASVPELGFVPADELAKGPARVRKALRARAIEALGEGYLVEASRVALTAPVAAARLARQGRDNLAAAAATYEELVDREAVGELASGRRASALARRRLGLEVSDAVAAWDAARGPEAVARARDAALELSRKAHGIELVGPSPAGAATIARHGEILLKAGRCAEAEEAMLAGRQRHPGSDRIADLLEVAMALRRSVAVPRAAAARLGPFVDQLPPCEDLETAALRPVLHRYFEALLDLHPGRMAEAAEVLLARLDQAAPGAGRKVAQEVRVVSGSGVPAVHAEHAALLRRLDPDDGALVGLLASDDLTTARAALAVSARWGFRTLGVASAVHEALVRSLDPGRRTAFLDYAAMEGSAPTLGWAADLLEDPDDDVRARAWAVVRIRIPAEARDAVGYDPAAPAAERAAAAARARAALRPTR